MTPKEQAAMQPSQQAVAAMRLALEALENAPIEYDFHGNPMDVEFGQQLYKAITALREALASCRLTTTEQAEQSQLADATLEPVAWIHDCAALCTNAVELWIDRCPHCGKPRAAPQPVVNCSQRNIKEYEEHVKRQRQWLNHDGSRKDGSIEYAAPVRTKDLTVSELDAIIEKHYDDEMDLKAMILDGIAADREKNK